MLDLTYLSKFGRSDGTLRVIQLSWILEKPMKTYFKSNEQFELLVWNLEMGFIEQSAQISAHETFSGWIFNRS